MTPSSLRDAVDAFRANDIATVLRAAGVVEIPKTKDGKTDLWVKLIGDPARISNALKKVNPRCRKALQYLQLAGDELRTSRFQSLLHRAGVLRTESKEKRPAKGAGYYGYTGQHPENALDPATFEEVLAALLKQGLIWTHTLPVYEPSNAKLGFEGGRFVYIPPEVLRHLPTVPEPERVKPQITQVLPGSARTYQRDLYLFWSIAREAAFQLTNSGLLRVSDLKRVSGQLLISETFASGNKESNFRRIFFLRRALMALGLLTASPMPGDNSLNAVLDAPFWQTEATQRVQVCFQSWRDGAWWNELWNSYDQGATHASGSLADFAPAAVVKARRIVLDTLIRMAGSGEDWIAFDLIVDYLHDHDEEFLVDRETAERGYGGYYYSSYSRQTTSPYLQNSLGWSWENYRSNSDAGWDGVEAVFVRSVLVEGLYWLGLLDLGYLQPVTPVGGIAPDGLQAVRLTDMGRWLLLDGPQPVIPAETGRVVAQPNFHIFAFDPISDAVLARLDSFATRLKAERAVEYEITRDSVYRAQQAGQSVSEMIGWLETTTGAPLPQNIARSLLEWQGAFERIIVRPRVGWVQTATPELADALLAQPGLRDAIVKRIGPTAVLLHADKVDQVERLLLAADELPARTTRPEDARRASITVAADGCISFVHAAPSLYVYGHLHPFADHSPAGWQVTAESVRRASGAGQGATAIIAALETLALGGVPDALQAHIKAWGEYYGDANVQTVTLMQFRDQDALNELRGDPILARYLKLFKPEARLGLATIKPGDLAAVQALLAERGIELMDK